MAIKGTVQSQCPVCKDIAIKLEDGRVKQQPSIGVIKTLKKVPCYKHKDHE